MRDPDNTQIELCTRIVEARSPSVEPAGVRPHRLRKVESLAMALRLIRSFGGITVQPTLALRTPPLDGLVVVPLAGRPILVRWELVIRANPDDDELAMAEAIRRLVDTNRTAAKATIRH